MKLTSVDGALKTIRTNPFRSWSSPKPESARSRFSRDDYFSVHHRPKFRIDPSEPVFTIGSCFARNVERILDRSGYVVLTKDFGIPVDLYFDHPNNSTAENGMLPGALNKYNVASMRVEMERCLGRRPEIPDNGFVEIEPGLWYDPHASNIKPAPLQSIATVRQTIEATNRRIREAKVVFITLGLTETWYDARSGLALNAVPPPQYLKATPDRYVFANAGIVDVLADLRAMLALFREECGADLKIVLTVSPVPLGSTWTEVDVITANTLSKATLRTAAGMIAGEDALTDYFPSYEMVLNTPRRLAFEADEIHVAEPMVQHIMDVFTKAYCR